MTSEIYLCDQGGSSPKLADKPSADPEAHAEGLWQEALNLRQIAQTRNTQSDWVRFGMALQRFITAFDAIEP